MLPYPGIFIICLPKPKKFMNYEAILHLTVFSIILYFDIMIFGDKILLQGSVLDFLSVTFLPFLYFAAIIKMFYRGR